MPRRPLLVLLAGRPGTGKTTLARRLATALQAASLRTDAIATAVLRSGLTDEPATAGGVAYVVAREVASGTLQAGTPVVVDGVNATHALREAWVELAQRHDARLVVFETRLPDADEHRRRVEARRPDLPDSGVPTWTQVRALPYDPWDENRDGPRHVIDMSDAESGAANALSRLPPAG